MIRKIIRIDKEKCNGCGVCADACHEGAIENISVTDLVIVSRNVLQVPFLLKKGKLLHMMKKP